MTQNTNELSSSGHKLGQMIGDWFEEFFVFPLLSTTAQKLELYLDYRFQRRAARGERVSWPDEYGNKVDYDFVLELGGSDEQLGAPVAFFESFWRRGVRHSKDKARDDSTKLVPMRETYPTARFLGIIAAGDFTSPARAFVASKEIDLFYVPKDKLVEAFRIHGLIMDYSDRASEQEKASVALAFERLFSATKKREVSVTLTNLIGRPTIELYSHRVLSRLSASPQEIRIILHQQSSPIIFNSISDVGVFLINPSFEMQHPQDYYTYEIIYSDGFQFSRTVSSLDSLSKLHDQVHSLNNHLNKLINKE